AKAMGRMNNKFEETAKLNQEVVIQDEVAYAKSQFQIHRKEEDPYDDLEAVDLEDEFDELFQAQEKDGNYHVYEKSMNSVTLEKRKKISGKTPPRPSGPLDGDKGGGLTDGAKFLQAHSELISNVRKLGEELTGKRGMKVALKALSDDVSKKGTDLNLLPYASDKIMQSIDEVNGHVQALLKKVSNIQKHEVAESEKSLGDLTNSTIIIIIIIKDKHVDLKSAGGHLIAEARNNERSNRQKDDWVQTKVNAALTKNGFGKHHASRLSKIPFNFETADLTKIHVHPNAPEDTAHGININNDEDTRDFNHVSAWAAGNAQANNFNNILHEDARVQAKLTTMTPALSKNTTRAGAMCVVEGAHFAAADADLDPDVLDGDGSEPWMLACRAHCCRYGPKAYPLPGAASLLVVLEGPICVQRTAISNITEHGVTMSVCPSFLETPEGQKCQGSSIVAVRVMDNVARFAPRGLAVHMVHAPTDAADDDDANPPPKKRGKSAAPKMTDQSKVAFLLSIPLLRAADINGVGGKVRQVVSAWNETRFKTKGEDAMWANRARWFRAHYK
ncbi:unnamed protein product, partial [Prorocentrum cordatum]